MPWFITFISDYIRCLNDDVVRRRFEDEREERERVRGSEIKDAKHNLKPFFIRKNES